MYIRKKREKYQSITKISQEAVEEQSILNFPRRLKTNSSNPILFFHFYTHEKMHACTSFPLCTPTPNPKTTTYASIINHPPIANPFSSQQRNSRRSNLSACRASWSSLNSPITEFNLYELLGVDASSDRAQIKEAYRALQKRCHPDIAGPSGHDMAIVLNEAYALLSDPNTRMAYDKVWA